MPLWWGHLHYKYIFYYSRCVKIGGPDTVFLGIYVQHFLGTSIKVRMYKEVMEQTCDKMNGKCNQIKVIDLREKGKEPSDI